MPDESMIDLPTLLCVTLCSLALCGAYGGVIAHQKKRRPSEGLLLGLFLGPVGLFIETMLPATQRPEVCEHAWSSFQSMVQYQDEPRSQSRGRKPSRKRQRPTPTKGTTEA